MHAAEVEHPEVGIAMPDVEHAILGKGEHKEPTVGRDARQCGALIHGGGIENKLAG